MILVLPLRVNLGTAVMAFSTDSASNMPLCPKKITGECLNCPDYSDFMENTLKPLLQEYQPNDIYNADETSFFYKILANGTYAFAYETV